MMVPKGGRMVITMVAVVMALGLSACGGHQDTAKPAAAATSKAAAAQGNYPPAPSVADIDAELRKLMDPTVASDQKLDLVQGVQADPTLPQRLADAYKQNNVTLTVIKVSDRGNGVIDAEAQVSISGGAPNPMVVSLVAEDGKWKVQKDWTCNTLSLVGQTSPACR
ncbi:hypothetical protein ACFXPS_00520 [Nocardia sp. NPDC059091]|uniref:hypothetical protein n=1 Tax=unclassified Nocardia TaxID=2637762 RepID=UPI00367F787D